MTLVCGRYQKKKYANGATPVCVHDGVFWRPKPDFGFRLPDNPRRRRTAVVCNSGGGRNECLEIEIRDRHGPRDMTNWDKIRYLKFWAVVTKCCRSAKRQVFNEFGEIVLRGRAHATRGAGKLVFYWFPFTGGVCKISVAIQHCRCRVLPRFTHPHAYAYIYTICILPRCLSTVTTYATRTHNAIVADRLNVNVGQKFCAGSIESVGAHKCRIVQTSLSIRSDVLEMSLRLGIGPLTVRLAGVKKKKKRFWKDKRIRARRTERIP